MRAFTANNSYRVFLIYIGLIFSGQLFSQDLDRVIKKGKRYYERQNYVEAEENLRTAFDEGIRDNEIATMLSNCYFELHEPHKARDVILKLENPNEENQYQLAWANYYIEEFNEASSLVTKISSSEDLDLDELNSKISLATGNYDNPEGFVIQNFGENINSDGREYSAVMYNDFNTLLFTSRREGIGSVDADGLAFEKIYRTTVDSTNSWIDPQNLDIKLEGNRQHDATVQVYGKGQKMISYHDGHLYFMELSDGTWEEKGQLYLHDMPGTETHCFISEDEKTVYFASDHQSGGLDLDLFKSTMSEDGYWSTPEPLENLNTEYDEDSPFLAADGTFYFSSRGHNSIGGYDVFKSRYDPDTDSWDDPVNLGHPINSVAEDIYFTTYGKLGYVSSSRRGGFGSLDLYRIFLFNKVKIQGKVVDENDGNPIPGVRVDFEYDSLLIRSYSDINGDYEMFVPVNKEMHVTFIKDTMNLYEGDYIANVFFKDENENEFNFFIADESDVPQNVADLQSSEEVKEIKVDIKNDFSQNPLVAIVPKTFEENWNDSISNVYTSLTSRKILPVSIPKAVNTIQAEDPEPEEISQEKIEDEILPVENIDDDVSGILEVYFGFDSSELTKESMMKLDKLYLDVLENNDLIVELEGHTDSRGSATYNIKLSLLRANSVMEYLKTKGQNSEKIFSNGFGESQLISQDQNERAHSLNRRVEIKYY